MSKNRWVVRRSPSGAKLQQAKSPTSPRNVPTSAMNYQTPSSNSAFKPHCLNPLHHPSCMDGTAALFVVHPIYYIMIRRQSNKSIHTVSTCTSHQGPVARALGYVDSSFVGLLEAHWPWTLPALSRVPIPRMFSLICDF